VKSKAGIPFLVIGIAFTAIGFSGQRAFIAIGVAFLAIGAVMIARQRRGAA